MADKTKTIKVVVDASQADRALEVLRKNFKATADVVKDTSKQVDSSMKDIDKSIKNVDSSLSFLTKAFKAAFVINAVADFGRQLYEINSKFQGFIATMTVVTGSVAASKREFEFITEIANKYGVSIQSLTSTYAKLAAAGKDSALTHNDLHKIFEAMAMASNVLHLSIEETRLVFYALQQMVSKGNVTMEELRRQLAEKFPGAVNLMAQALEVPVKEMEKMIKSGQVAADQALPKFADQIIKAFGPASQYAVKSLNAEVSRLHNAWFIFIQKMAETSNLLPAIVDVIQWLTKSMNDNGSAAQSIGNEMAKVVKITADWLKSLTPEDIRNFFKTISDIIGALVPVLQLGATALQGWALILGPAVKQLADLARLFVDGQWMEGFKKFALLVAAGTGNGVLAAQYAQVADSYDRLDKSANKVTGTIKRLGDESGKYGKTLSQQLVDLAKEYELSERNISIKTRSRDALSELNIIEKQRQELLAAAKDTTRPEEERIKAYRTLISQEADYVKLSKEANQERKQAETAYNQLLQPALNFRDALIREADQIALTREQIDKKNLAVMLEGLKAADRIKLTREITAAQERLNNVLRDQQNLKDAEGRVKLAEDELKNLDSQIEKQEKHNLTVSFGAQAYREYEIALLEAALAQAELNYVVDENSKLTMAEYELLGKKIEKLKILIDLKKQGNERDTYIEQMRAAVKEDLSLWRDLDRYTDNFFKDLILRGKDAFTSLRNDLKLFAAELASLAMKKFIFNIIGNLVGGSPGAVMTNIAQSAGANTVAGRVFDAGANWIGSTALGGMWGNFSAGYTAQSAFLAGTAESAPVMGTLTGQMGTWAANAMDFMAPIMANPITWIVAAAVVVAAVLNSRRGGDKIGGSASVGIDADGNISDFTDPSGRLFTPNQEDTAMRRFGEDWARGFMSTLNRLGGSSEGVNATFGFDTDPRGSAQNRFAARVYGADGSLIYSGMSEGGRDNEDMQRLTELEATRALVAALKSSDLPSRIMDVFSEIDPNTASLEELKKALAMAQEIADVMAGISELEGMGFNISYESLEAMARDGETISQTFQRVSGTWTSFASSFMPESEKLRLATLQVNEAFGELGIAVPATRAEFYNIVQGLDLTTEAGRQAFDTLMGVSGAFGVVADASAAASAQLASQAQQLASINLQASGVSSNQANIQLLTGQFMSNASWTQGMSWQAVANALTTITQEDFANYSESQRALILQIRQAQLSDMQQMSSASQNVTSSFDNAAEAAARAAEELARMRGQLREWALGKLLGGASSLSPEEQIALAMKEYENAVATGDIQKFQDISDKLLDLMREYDASGQMYQDIFTRIMQDAEKLGQFDLGFGGYGSSPESRDSIDRMNQDLGERIDRHRAETVALRAQVADLIAAVKNASTTSAKAARESAAETTRILVGVLEGTRR